MIAASPAPHGPRPALKLVHVDTPARVPGRVLVRVEAATVGEADLRALRGRSLRRWLGASGIRGGGTAVGTTVAGRVAEVGADVTRFRPGDPVFGSARGTLAEYASVPEDRLAHSPAGADPAELAAVARSGVAALRTLRAGGPVAAGRSILVTGAPGDILPLAVQLAKACGLHVTVSCDRGSAFPAPFPGADDVLGEDDCGPTGPEPRFDLVLDTDGDRSPSGLRRLLRPGGTLVLARWTGGRRPGRIGRLLEPLAAPPSAGHSVRVVRDLDGATRAELDSLARLMEAGTLTSVVDRRFPLRDASDAVRYVASGRARGTVIVTIC